jgi:DNA primase
MDTKMYRVCCKYQTGLVNSSPPLTLEMAEGIVAALNKNRIEIHHWVEPFCASRNSGSKPDLRPMAPNHSPFVNDDL